MKKKSVLYLVIGIVSILVLVLIVVKISHSNRSGATNITPTPTATYQEKTAYLFGSVFNRNGQKLPKIKVQIGDYAVTTAQDGTYSLPMLDFGNKAVTFTDPNGAALFENTSSYESLELTVKAGNTRQDFHLDTNATPVPSTPSPTPLQQYFAYFQVTVNNISDPNAKVPTDFNIHIKKHNGAELASPLSPIVGHGYRSNPPDGLYDAVQYDVSVTYKNNTSIKSDYEVSFGGSCANPTGLMDYAKYTTNNCTISLNQIDKSYSLRGILYLTDGTNTIKASDRGSSVNVSVSLNCNGVWAYSSGLYADSHYQINSITLGTTKCYALGTMNYNSKSYLSKQFTLTPTPSVSNTKDVCINLKSSGLNLLTNNLVNNHNYPNVLLAQKPASCVN